LRAKSVKSFNTTRGENERARTADVAARRASANHEAGALRALAEPLAVAALAALRALL
jgi:hypothetical protein